MLSAGAAPDSTESPRLRDAFTGHLQQIDRLLARRRMFQVLRVDYERALAAALEIAHRVRTFTGLRLDVDAMAAAVDPPRRHETPASFR
jgi:hypothetical protein